MSPNLEQLGTCCTPQYFKSSVLPCFVCAEHQIQSVFSHCRLCVHKDTFSFEQYLTGPGILTVQLEDYVGPVQISYTSPRCPKHYGKSTFAPSWSEAAPAHGDVPFFRG